MKKLNWFWILAVAGFIINTALLICILFSNPAKQEEIKKAWGIENYNKLMELFSADAYKIQQAKAIGNFEAQLEQLENPINNTWTTE